MTKILDFEVHPGVTVRDVRPEIDGKSDRYSWNLYRWLRHWARGRRLWGSGLIVMDSQSSAWDGAFQAFDAASPHLGRLFLGRWDDDYFVGARLSRVMTEPFPRGPDGLPANVGAWVPKTMRQGLDVTEWFWPGYAKDGRCHLAPDHAKGWEDFEYVNSQFRRCRWCGFTQLAEHEERVETTVRWRQAA